MQFIYADTELEILHALTNCRLGTIKKAGYL